MEIFIQIGGAIQAMVAATQKPSVPLRITTPQIALLS
jgi:hypothetical protein